MRTDRPRLILAAACAAALCACGTKPVAVADFAKPYRITVQQGNYVSREMVEQLKPGMTKEQVRFVLGTPLLTDIFHANRWDYVFSLDVPGKGRVQRNFSVVFENERLSRVIGDLLPSEGEIGFAPRAAKPEALKPVATKPETAKAEAVKPVATKPETAKAEAVKPAAVKPEPAKAAADPSQAWGNTTQNWGTAIVEEPTPAPDPASAAKPAAVPEGDRSAEPKSERGFFGRMLDRIRF